MVKIHISLSEVALKWVDEQAKALGITRSKFIERLIIDDMTRHFASKIVKAEISLFDVPLETEKKEEEPSDEVPELF